MKWFENLVAQHKARVAEKQFRAGFGWAANTLFRKEMSAQEIRDRCEVPFDGPNFFDKGAVAAVDFYEDAVAVFKGLK